MDKRSDGLRKDAAAGRKAADRLIGGGSAKEFLDNLHFRGAAVIRQALNEYSSILLFQNAVIQQHEQATIVQASGSAVRSLVSE